MTNYESTTKKYSPSPLAGEGERPTNKEDVSASGRETVSAPALAKKEGEGFPLIRNSSFVIRNCRFKIVLLLFIFAISYSFAGEINFSASVDKNRMALNEYLGYSLTVSGDASGLPEPKIADLADFNIYGTGKSQSFSFVNGKRSGSITYSYTLSPKKTGKFTIPSAKIEYENKTYKTEPIEIEVTDAAAYPQAQQTRTSQTRQAASGRTSDAKAQGNVFVKAAVNKNKVYVNEKLIYKFDFYTNVDLMSNPEYSPPDFKGFWNDSSKPGRRYENIDGVNYIVSDIETTLYAIESGSVTISPARLKVNVMDLSSQASFDDIFSIFSGMGIRGQEKILETDLITVAVLPLPDKNRPADFKGAVGNFEISASLDTAEAYTGDLVTLTVKVTGKGNMKSVNDVGFTPSKDFKVYDIVSSSNDAEDSKEFKILLMPLTPGEKTVPPVRLSFFDPDKAAYSYAESLPLKIRVEGTAVANTDNNQGRHSNIINVQNDINYNKDLKNLCSYGGYFVRNKIFWMIFSLFILLLILAVFYRIRILRKNNNPEAKLKAEADILSKKYIGEAAGKLDVKTGHDFYEAVYSALLYGIMAKTGIRSDNLHAGEIMENLKKSGLSEDISKEIRDVINQVNFYRFTSIKPDEKSMLRILNKVKEILNILR
ncbi:MAG: BatD family protein [Firmicutes bacterium]|nr:BatD family protein [Bacillota bacterium]